MQENYITDREDVGKFQFFRYLFNDSKSPFDAKDLSQILFSHKREDNFERMMATDEYLEYSPLDIIMRNKREVIELEKLKLLKNIQFFEQEIPKALEDRYLWLNRALTFANKSQIVAVSPDNGMALSCKRAKNHFEFLTLAEDYKQKVYPQKYIFRDELSYFYRLPYLEVCIVYQHLSDCFAQDRQINFLLTDLHTEYEHVIAIKHKPSIPRVFFFLCKSMVIRESIELRLREFANTHQTLWEVFC